jgi:branched-chain amino acid transport system substrate-binding protein
MKTKFQCRLTSALTTLSAAAGAKKARTLLALASLALAASTPAQAQIKIGVIASATGPTATVGIPQKNSAALLPKKIGDVNIEYVLYDDASDSTQSVQLAKKLLSEHKVDALIGPSGSPNAMGLLQFVAEAQTPMLAPVGTPAVVTPMDDKKRWVFKTHPNDDVMADAVIEHMIKTGVKTVGFIGYSDPYGESWFKTIDPMLKKAGIQLVANERYNRQDQSVTGQVLKIVAAKPDVVLVAGTGAAAALPQVQLVDAGYKGRVYQTHGGASPDLIRIGGKKVEGVIITAPWLLVVDSIPDGIDLKKVATPYVAAYEKMYGNRPPIFGAGVYDAGLLLQNALPEALKKAKPGTPEFRVALRDALEATKGVVCTQGVVNMTPQDHSGFAQHARVLVTVKDGKFMPLKD